MENKQKKTKLTRNKPHEAQRNTTEQIHREAQSKRLQKQHSGTGACGSQPQIHPLIELDSGEPQSVQEMKSKYKRNAGNKTNCAQNKSIDPETLRYCSFMPPSLRSQVFSRGQRSAWISSVGSFHVLSVSGGARLTLSGF